MNRRTVVRREAQIDVREAALWYESREPDLGVRFASEVRTSLHLIANNPLRFPLVDEAVRRALLHSFPYCIYFLTSADDIVVIAVLHQHRHANAWQDRR
jgi:plasmid stabilization system protein ParE